MSTAARATFTLAPLHNADGPSLAASLRKPPRTSSAGCARGVSCDRSRKTSNGVNAAAANAPVNEPAATRTETDASASEDNASRTVG